MPSIEEILGPISQGSGGTDADVCIKEYLLSLHEDSKLVFSKVTQANPEDRIKLLVRALQQAISAVSSREGCQEKLKKILTTLHTLEFSLASLMKLTAEDVIALAIPGIGESEKSALEGAIDAMKSPDGRYHRYPVLPKVKEFSPYYSAPKDGQLGAKLVELLKDHRPWSCLALLRQKQTEYSIKSIFTPRDGNILQTLAEAFHRGYLDPVACSQMLAQLGKLIGEHTTKCTPEFLLGFAQLAYDGHPEIYFSLLEQKKGDTASELAIPQEWQVALWTKDRVVVRVRGVNDPAYDYPTLRLIAEKAPSQLKKAFAIILEYPLKDQFVIFNGSSKSPAVLKQCKQLVTEKIKALTESIGIEDREGGAIIKARLEQMSYRGDKKKQSVLSAIDAIVRAFKTPSERLSAIKRALNDQTSDLYKALNMKRWGGFALWDKTTGSYKAIKGAFDSIEPSGSGAAAAAARGAAKT